MKHLKYILIGIILTVPLVSWGLPYFQQTQGLVPGATNTYYIGTSSPSLLEYKGIFTRDLTISGTCTGCGGVGGATSTHPLMASWFVATNTAATSTFEGAIQINQGLEVVGNVNPSGDPFKPYGNVELVGGGNIVFGIDNFVSFGNDNVENEFFIGGTSFNARVGLNLLTAERLYRLPDWSGEFAVSTSTTQVSSINATSTTGISYFGGRVGIATSSPSFPLSVQGPGLISGPLTVQRILATSTSCTSAIPYSFDFAQTTGFCAASASEFRFVTSGTAVGRLTGGSQPGFQVGGTGVYGAASEVGIANTVSLSAGGFGMFSVRNGTAVLGYGGFNLGTTTWFNGRNATSSVFVPWTESLGLSTTSPWGRLSISATSTSGLSNYPLLVVSTSTASATTTAFIIDNNGKTGVGTSSPQFQFGASGVVWGDQVKSKAFFISDTTDSNTGVIFQGLNRFIHTYGTVGNIFIGKNAGNFTTNGRYNIAIGESVLTSLGTGPDGNVGIGYLALTGITSGYGNIAIGQQAGQALTTGDSNILIGGLAGSSLPTNQRLAVLIGANAGLNLTSAATVVGSDALKQATLISNTTVMGASAATNMTGNSTTMFGASAGFGAAGSTGHTNSGFGHGVLLSINAGNTNSGFGYFSLNGVNSGSQNSGFGGSSGENIAGGSRNSVFGYQAGVTQTSANTLTTGNDNTFIGYQTGLNSSTQRSRATALGYRALVGCDDCIVLGNNNAKVGIGTTSPLALLTVSATSSLSNLPLFLISTSSLSATTTAFTVTSLGRVGVATSSPYKLFSIDAASSTEPIGILQTIGGTAYTTYSLDQYGRRYTGGPTPTVASGAGDCGTSPSIVGNDDTMTVTVGTGANGNVCTITLAKERPDTKYVCNANDNSTAVNVRITTKTVSSFKLEGVFSAGDTLDVNCVGYK